MNALREASPNAGGTYLGYGLPVDRQARIDQRRRFVQMKADLMCACAVLGGTRGERLRHAVRQAGEAVQLWRLRRIILDALPATHPRSAGHRDGLARQITQLFPDSAF